MSEETKSEVTSATDIVMPSRPGWYLVEVAGLARQPESGFMIDYCREASPTDGGGMQWVDNYRHTVIAWHPLSIRKCRVSNSTHRSSDETLIVALRELAATVTSDDGVANQAIGEAADRLAALSEAIGEIRDAVLNERYQMAEMDFGSDRVNAILGIIDDHDPRVI